MARNPSLKELRDALGARYQIRVIDLEQCLYRDFGNGFNVEISGVSRPITKNPAILYLWFGDTQPNFVLVKSVMSVAPPRKSARPCSGCLGCPR